jgi:hypothetical protein
MVIFGFDEETSGSRMNKSENVCIESNLIVLNNIRLMEKYTEHEMYFYCSLQPSHETFYSLINIILLCLH